MKYFYGLIFTTLSFQIAQSQLATPSPNLILTKVRTDTIKNLNRIENELYLTQLKRLQNDLILRNHLFYALDIFTENGFLEYYKEKELSAYAYNPPWEKIKQVLRLLETDFNIWSTAYSQSQIFSGTNYLEIRHNFELVKTTIIDQFNDSCNETDKCNKIKQKLTTSRVHVNDLIQELTKFLLL